MKKADTKRYEILSQLATELDAKDILASSKSAFTLPDDVVYLDGNSLGPMSNAASNRAKEVVEEQWGQSLISSWNVHNWIGLPQSVGKKLSPMLGCDEQDVICCDSISVNLFKLVSAALRINKKRHLVVSTDTNFPSDLYTVQGLSDLLTEQHCELLVLSPQSLVNVIQQRGHDIAVLMLTHVDFRTGEFFDMGEITSLAHQHNILVLWDLAHSAGVLPLHLNDLDVDFAVGCTYKYLNGGPGAPAFLYVNKRWQPTCKQPLSGWMGHKHPFEFSLVYEPADGVQQFLSGTPPIISMSVLDAALDVFDRIALEHIWRKSVALSEFFHRCLIEFKIDIEFSLLTDLQQSNRNGQLAYQHPHAYAICQALIKHKVIGDYRAPNILRLGFSPLFLSYADILEATNRLREIVQSRSYLSAEFSTKSIVT